MRDTLCHQWNSERILANTYEPLMSSLVTSRLDTLGILGNPATSIRPEHNLILIWKKGLGVAGCGTGGQLVWSKDPPELRARASTSPSAQAAEA